MSSHRTEYNFVLTTLITFSFEHHNRIHKEEEQIAAPPLVVAMQPAQLRGWDRIRNRSRSSLLLAHEGTRAGDFARALSEAGSLGRGTTAEQLRALTELVSLQTRKIDSLEEVAGESRQRLDEMQSVLSDAQRRTLDVLATERRERRRRDEAARSIAMVVAEVISSKPTLPSQPREPSQPSNLSGSNSTSISTARNASGSILAAAATARGGGCAEPSKPTEQAAPFKPLVKEVQTPDAAGEAHYSHQADVALSRQLFPLAEGWSQPNAGVSPSAGVVRLVAEVAEAKAEVAREEAVQAAKEARVAQMEAAAAEVREAETAKAQAAKAQAAKAQAAKAEAVQTHHRLGPHAQELLRVAESTSEVTYPAIPLDSGLCVTASLAASSPATATRERRGGGGSSGGTNQRPAERTTTPTHARATCTPGARSTQSIPSSSSGASRHPTSTGRAKERLERSEQRVKVASPGAQRQQSPASTATSKAAAVGRTPPRTAPVTA